MEKNHKEIFDAVAPFTRISRAHVHIKDTKSEVIKHGKWWGDTNTSSDYNCMASTLTTIPVDGFVFKPYKKNGGHTIHGSKERFQSLLKKFNK